MKAIKAIAVTAVLAVGCGLWPAAAATLSFADWQQDFTQQAIEAGIAPETVAAALSGTEPDPRVLDLDQKQPEQKIGFASYLENTVTDRRVEKARALYREHRTLLRKIAARYHVQPRFILALWGMETSFGASSGDFSVPNSLATLAWDGRRAEFFTTELLAALRIMERDHIAPGDMLGSWAGAMGQVQFMPSTYLKYAVSFSGHGRPDIWNNLPDVFASAANYLSTEGWRGDQGWGRKVILPPAFARDDDSQDKTRSLAEWAALGVKSAGKAALPKSRDIMATLITPEGADGGAWLVYGNYDVLMKWNRSIYFATAVGIFADRIGNL